MAVHLSKPRVVIVGGGFGGINAAKALKHARAEVVLLDMTNYHLFQPLLYQVAIGALSPGEIATPIRTILNGYKNTQVIMAEATSIDLDRRTVILSDGEISYDYLILAPGARHSYFNHPEWEQFAPGLKNLGDALKIRERVLLSFERAERYYNTPEARKYLTFVIVGAGPTGVEVAGAIAEIGRKTILPDFPMIKSEDIKVLLVEAGPRIIPTFDQKLAEYTYKALNKLGVQIKTNTKVTDVNDKGVQTSEAFIETRNIIWAAGNEASPLLKTLNVPLDKSGRVFVNSDMSIKDNPDIFVIGDAAATPLIEDKKKEAESKDSQKKPKYVPGVAQGAIQEGEFVAKIIENRIAPGERKQFKYHDKGSLATIGAAKAIADFGKLKFTGFLAWLIWSIVHIFFIIGFRNRVRIMIEWIWYYITFQPGARLIVYSSMRKKDARVESDIKQKAEAKQ